MGFFIGGTMNRKSNKLWVALIALAACIAVMYGVFVRMKPKTEEGSKHIIIEVADNNGDLRSYEFATDAEFLKQAMDELAARDEFTFEGEDGDYGFFITSVNGVKAVYEEDGAYWSIYVNEEYGQYGADQQPVTDGDTYRLAYEVSSW